MSALPLAAGAIQDSKFKVQDLPEGILYEFLYNILNFFHFYRSVSLLAEETEPKDRRKAAA
ncbi:MAG: hypothetical protein K9K88_18280 [Desulfobacterales bacterium]|nr:hypothetical protein [Desulfobacterales bacterium]